MNISKEARDIHYSALVVDTHSDSLAWPTRHGVDIGQPQEKTHMDLPRMREGNQNVQFFACFASPSWIENKKVVQVTLDYMDSFHTLMRDYPDQIEQATTADDVRRIIDAGKLVGVLCIEGGHSIDDDLSILRMYHRLGARYMTLTWNNTNNWADGVLDEPRHDGLNHFGKEVVREMNRLGMLVDISHVAPATFWDAIETSIKPVIASHSSAKVICAAPRNLDDDQIRAVADNGGVIGVNYEITFVGEAYRVAKATLDDEKTEAVKRAEKDHPQDSDSLKSALREIDDLQDEKVAELRKPHYTEIVDHIDHMVSVAGVDHVGLGSDFDGATMPEGMEDCTKVPLITDELVRRGYSEGDIRKILGENFMRVMEEVLTD
ncbi:MAG: membrane dipeptidase [Dehalococcoidia bacterium]|nr:membrane dipeptidase [Dehalococcoidia bacterium]